MSAAVQATVAGPILRYVAPAEATSARASAPPGVVVPGSGPFASTIGNVFAPSRRTVPAPSLLVVAAAAPLAHTAATTASNPAKRRTTIWTPLRPCPLGRGRAQGSANSPIRPVNTLGSMFDEGLAELHTHLGGSVASEILWSLAHEQGIALPVKDYWEFDALVTVSDPRGVANLDALDRIYHWTELIQSSPLAVERSVHAAIGGAYRSQRITTLELRFNPMKRNRGGERDLDHIILAAVRGLDVARLEYPQVRCGLILMMDRTFAPRQNEIVVEKAIRWASRGVVGVDIAGPRPGGGRYDYTQIKPMVETAREAGLGVTIHVGEEGETGAEELGEVIEHLRPERIGHGILAARDPELMRQLRDAGTVLEICPTSNLLTKALADEDAVRDTFRAFVENGVAFTIATDGPEMMHTHLRDELELLERIGALTREELETANRRGHEASFIPR